MSIKSEADHDATGEILALADLWRLRASVFTRQAALPNRAHDAVRLTAMATALEWAAGDLVLFGDRLRASTSNDTQSTDGDSTGE